MPETGAAAADGAGIHAAAADGFAAGAAAYGAGRPDYPAAVADWLTGDLGLGPGRRVLDLGAGTGKFLPYLRATGADVVAVEPVAAMRAALLRAHPEATALAGTAEAIPLEAACLDAVVCAQAFHWFAGAAALAEIARVLRPGGRLGLIWNVRDERVPWVAALSRITDPHEGGAPRYRTGAWRAAFPAPGFGPLRERRFPHVHRGPAEAVVVDRTLSVSFVAALPEAERAAVAGAVRALVAETPELAGAEVAFPYETVAFTCMRA
ncbi:class I SAM-dependent methyltransferase [Methylobacterium sp. NEAU 140]|uniref:class I SAM-dependent methyltransferase n=1 Tax=Methylobacterium sp. NEAU 140 TaxID=3064945 RepID=UPI0027337C0C|nr:class I SAM-dependent methyltransferase [Methylobacterium sp. NEAU 140]MDP4024595.1 class I SAM-dependent methyltransferase [Methylobacterium sp. NEAU 140]